MGFNNVDVLDHIRDSCLELTSIAVEIHQPVIRLLLIEAARQAEQEINRNERSEVNRR